MRIFQYKGVSPHCVVQHSMAINILLVLIVQFPALYHNRCMFVLIILYTTGFTGSNSSLMTSYILNFQAISNQELYFENDTKTCLKSKKSKIENRKKNLPYVYCNLHFNFCNIG